MIGDFREVLQRPAARLVSGAGKQADQERSRVGLFLFQDSFDGLVRRRSGLEGRQTRRVLDAEGLDNVKIAVDSVSLLCFARWPGLEVRQIVDRTPGAACIQSPWRAGKKSQQVGFGQAMEIDDEVKLRFADFADELKNPPDRNQLHAITQRNAIDFQHVIGKAGKSDDLAGGFADRNRDSRVWETSADGTQRR